MGQTVCKKKKKRTTLQISSPVTFIVQQYNTYQTISGWKVCKWNMKTWCHSSQISAGKSSDEEAYILSTMDLRRNLMLKMSAF